MLRDSEKKEEYEESTRIKGNERMGRETGKSRRMQWKKMVEVMNEAAEEVCGLESGRVANPWIIGHEREVNEMIGRDCAGEAHKKSTGLSRGG